MPPPPYYKWDKRKKVLNNDSTEYLKIIQSSKNPFNFGANPGPDPDDEHFLKTKSVFFFTNAEFSFFSSFSFIFMLKLDKPFRDSF